MSTDLKSMHLRNVLSDVLDELKPKTMTVTMPNGSKWSVPVWAIAIYRAQHYAKEFGGVLADSLKKDTIPLFNNDEYAIEDWAVNNMNWSDFDGYQRKVADAPLPDFQEAWLSGNKEVKYGN